MPIGSFPLVLVHRFQSGEPLPWLPGSWPLQLAAAVLVGGAIVILVRQFRRRRLREIERLRTRIASDLHDEIGSALGSIALMADHMSDRFTPEESSFRRLQEMSHDARQMSDSLREIIWFVDTERSSIPDLADRLRSLAQSKLPRTITVEFSAPPAGSPEVILTMEQKRHLILMFKEMLHNIARHAKPTDVGIAVRHANRRLEIRVQDNGQGFDQSGVKRGNGLVNLHRRALELRGECDIRSNPGTGTSIRISVPVG